MQAPNLDDQNLGSLMRPCIVISQPMYFPWTGMLEQIRLSDIFVDYNDVQFSKGSFFNRVQIKTTKGIQWLSVPLRHGRLGQLIRDTQLDQTKNWQRSHLDQLRNAYASAPFFRDMLDVVTRVFDSTPRYLGELAFASTQSLLDYFPSIKESTSFFDSSKLGIGGSGTNRVLSICSKFNARSYLTGHGARHYLDHEVFEEQGICVAYIDYNTQQYPQLHGAFTPFVSSLDLIANCGKDGSRFIGGTFVPWREFLARHFNAPVKK